MRHLEAFLARLGDVREGEGRWHAYCPCHDSTTRKLEVTLGEGGRIIFYCHACGRGKKVADAILAAMGLGWIDTFPVKGERGVPLTRDRGAVLTERAVSLRHRAYSFLASEVPLSTKHATHLLDRGLGEAHVWQDGYFTVEQVTPDDVGRCVLELGEAVFTVPGFERDAGGVPRFRAGRGIFIPVRDEQRRIVAGQVRGFGDVKYRWLGGIGSPYHVPLCVSVGETVWLTEGPLKAEVAAVLGGFPVVGVAGAGAWRSVLPLLRRCGCKRVVVAFDADWRTNPAVQNSLTAALQGLSKAGYGVIQAEWDIELGKGLDDLIATGHSSRMRVADIDQKRGEQWEKRSEKKELGASVR